MEKAARLASTRERQELTEKAPRPRKVGKYFFCKPWNSMFYYLVFTGFNHSNRGFDMANRGHPGAYRRMRMCGCIFEPMGKHYMIDVKHINVFLSMMSIQCLDSNAWLHLWRSQGVASGVDSLIPQIIIGYTNTGHHSSDVMIQIYLWWTLAINSLWWKKWYPPFSECDIVKSWNSMLHKGLPISSAGSLVSSNNYYT